jgi:hypothetical protein
VIFLVVTNFGTFAAAVERGLVVSRDELIAPLAPEPDHPLPRVVIKVDEDEMSSSSGAKDVVVIHYRAVPTSKYSFNDDVVAIAIREDDRYKLAEVLQSDAGVVAGDLESQNDYEEEFVSVNGLRFLYIRNRISGTGDIVEQDVYRISGASTLVALPFADLRKTKTLKAGEESQWVLQVHWRRFRISGRYLQTARS